MAAPKNPNVAKAAETRRKMGDLTASNRLVDAGYLVLKPEELAVLPDDLKRDLCVVLKAFDVRIPPALARRAA